MWCMQACLPVVATAGWAKPLALVSEPPPENWLLIADRGMPAGNLAQTPSTIQLNDAAQKAVQRIKSADQRGLRELYDRVAPLALSVAVKILRDQTDAEEVVQEAFLEIWRRGQTYEERGFALAWVMSIVRSRAIDRLRSKRSLQRAVAGVAAEPAPENTYTPALETVEARLEREKLIAAVSQLSPEQQRAIELAYFAGLTHEEISQQTAEPLGTVKTRIRSAIQKLQGALLGARREAR